jgi:fructokinase
VVITRGPQGAVVVREAGEQIVEGRAATVVDSIGAGDAFGGGLLAWWHARGLRRTDLGSGEALIEATRFACEVAALTVEQAGAEPPRTTDLPAGSGYPG